MSSDFLASKMSGFAPNDLATNDLIYINKYWLNADELAISWAPVLVGTFVSSENGVLIKPGRCIDIRCGGILFEEQEFKIFANNARELTSKNFAIIEDVGQNSWTKPNTLSFFRFSFPIDITWIEMSKSCLLAEDIFSRPIRCFYVILDNGLAGKYVNNDDEVPYEVAFNPPPY